MTFIISQAIFDGYKARNWHIVIALLCIALGILIHRRYFLGLSHVPGPFFASITRLWHAQVIVKGGFHTRLMQLHEQHGHFVRIAHNEVSISHPDGISRVLLAPLKKAPWYRAMAWPDYRFQNQMSALEPHAQKSITRYLASGYTLTNLLQAEQEFDRVVGTLLGCLDRLAEKAKPIDLGKYLHFAIYDIAGEMFFSNPLGFLEAESDIGNAIGTVAKLNRYAAVAGFFYGVYTFLLANPLVTSMKILPMGYLNHLTTQALDERMAATESRFDIFEHWLREHQEHPLDFTKRDIFSNVVFNIPAGSDSPANVLHAIFYYVVRHPASHQRIRDEIDAAIAEGHCLTPVVSYVDAKNLRYLQACIKESLRVYSALAVSIPRVAGDGGVTIGQQTFPKGTILSVNPWVMHYSKECWGSDADEFKPQRWLTSDAVSKEKYLMSFGAGYNACPGQNLAKMELSKITATLLRDYDIQQLSPEKHWSITAHATVIPHSWPVYVKKRR